MNKYTHRFFVLTDLYLHGQPRDFLRAQILTFQILSYNSMTTQWKLKSNAQTLLEQNSPKDVKWLLGGSLQITPQLEVGAALDEFGTRSNYFCHSLCKMKSSVMHNRLMQYFVHTIEIFMKINHECNVRKWAFKWIMGHNFPTFSCRGQGECVC